MGIGRIATFGLALVLLTGCAEEFMVLHSQTGDPLIIARRSYRFDDCVGKLRQDAALIGATFRYVHVRGTVAGRSLLWPFAPGYACEAALGPEQRPSGTYPIDLNILTHKASNPIS
jgi:hypothetical protein